MFLSTPTLLTESHKILGPRRWVGKPFSSRLRGRGSDRGTFSWHYSPLVTEIGRAKGFSETPLNRHLSEVIPHPRAVDATP